MCNKMNYIMTTGKHSFFQVIVINLFHCGHLDDT